MCDSCEAMRINGILCHEHGCPEAHKGTLRVCKWCGSKFEPENATSSFCSQSCYCDFNGIEDPEEDRMEDERDPTHG